MTYNPMHSPIDVDLKQHVIHHIKGERSGPVVVLFGGIHGNEKAGVEAMGNVLKNVSKTTIYGDVYGIKGNIKALKENKRFIKADLNRLWTNKNISILKQKESLLPDEEEQLELLLLLETILKNEKQPLYFIDLHTTSSKTLPFITINDAIINRKFSQYFHIPVVLGIEEYLDGPLLSYLNTLGYVSLGFEAGQHQDPKAIINCESFIYLALFYSGAMKRSSKVRDSKRQLRIAAKETTNFFEVIFKYEIKPMEDFCMKPGFKSFQYIKKGDVLANSNGKEIQASHSAQLFMPLYQKSGSDGFFIIKPISHFSLTLSTYLRKIKADYVLAFFPGISWHDKSKGVLKANLRVTRILAKSIFHLLGYRNKHIDKTHVLLYNRERVAKNYMYRNNVWFKNKNPIEK